MRVKHRWNILFFLCLESLHGVLSFILNESRDWARFVAVVSSMAGPGAAKPWWNRGRTTSKTSPSQPSKGIMQSNVICFSSLLTAYSRPLSIWTTSALNGPKMEDLVDRERYKRRNDENFQQRDAEGLFIRGNFSLNFTLKKKEFSTKISDLRDPSNGYKLMFSNLWIIHHKTLEHTQRG